MLQNEGGILKKVVVCSPVREYFDVDNLEKHNITEKANPQKAKKQHDQLKSIMRCFGVSIMDLEELHGHPNSVFTQDTAICTPNGYIKLRMGIPSREGEEKWMAKALKKNGVPKVGEIKKPGTVEGGDVILAGKIAFVGQSGRTNIEGIKQLISILSPMGYEIRVAKIPPPSLHIGGIMSVISPDTVISVTKAFPKNYYKGYNVIDISYSSFISGNVITLGNMELVANKLNIEGIKQLETHNYKVHKVDLSEFTKGTGGPSCLIMPLERMNK